MIHKETINYKARLQRAQNKEICCSKDRSTYSQKTTIQKKRKVNYQKSYFQKNKIRLNSARKIRLKNIQLAEENPTCNLVACVVFSDYNINVIFSSRVLFKNEAKVKIKQEFNFAGVSDASKETNQVNDDV